MYTQYFGFRKPPFKITPDSGFFYTNAVFLDAHCTLLDAIDEQRGLNLLTGEPGTGKTTLLHRLAQDLDETVHFIYLQNSNLSLQDLVGRLLDKLGIAETGQPRASIEAEIHQLRDHLRTLVEREQGCVLFVDDAQNLPLDTLNALPELVKADDASNQLQIVLSGSPELLVKLADPSMSAVSKLVAAHARLDRLPAGEIAAFIDHQIRVAGSMRSDIFSEPAIREITQTTSGRPSDINQVCDKALEIAYRQGTQVVTREIIRQTSSMSWLEIDAAESNEAPPATPIKQLIGKAASSISRSRLPAAGEFAPRQLARRLAPLVRFLAQRRITLGRPVFLWGRNALDRLGVLALIGIAKLWKLVAQISRITKHFSEKTFSKGQSLWQNKTFELRRRHALIAAGLTVLAAFVGLLAIAPGPETDQLAQRTAPKTASTEIASAETTSTEVAATTQKQAPVEKLSGRHLSEIAALRAQVAQLSLDLKTTVSNRNYLKKRVDTLTSERNELAIKHAQVKFAQNQLQLTLATTRKQVTDLQSDLSKAQALVQLRKDDARGNSDLSLYEDEAAGYSAAPRPAALSQTGSLELTARQKIEEPDTQPSGPAPQRAPTELSSRDQTKIAELSQSTSSTPMDYISDSADPLVTAANTLLSNSDDTAIIAGVPQITGNAPTQAAEDLSATAVSNDQEITVLSAPSGDAPEKAKKTFSDHTVALLLHKAKRLYLKDMLTTPSGNNAYDVYMQILEGNPGHAKATAGVQKIASRYLDWAETEVTNGNKTKALRYYKKALSVVPGQSDIAERIAALEGSQVTPSRAAPREVVQSTRETERSEAARARLKTLRIEVSERSLLRAVEAGNLEIAGLLIDAGISPDAQNVSKQTALLTAAINGDEAITKLLLKRGADVNKINSMGRSPLIAAAWNGNASLVSVLLKGGADIEITSNEGWNALMYAAWNGHRATVRALLKTGVQVNAVNAQGWTALMNAAWNGHSETVRVLLEHGANAGHETPSGETARLVASQQGHRETALLLE